VEAPTAPTTHGGGEVTKPAAVAEGAASVGEGPRPEVGAPPAHDGGGEATAPAVVEGAARGGVVGGSLVASRWLSLEEVPAWADHAFFRQREGWPHSDDRFPLVPMTGIVEMLQEHANRVHPALVPVAVVDIAAFRWLTVDPPVEITLRASTIASQEGDPAGSVRVKAAIDGHARATVVLAPRYPARTPANAAKLVNERPSHIEATRFYVDRHMFHGPAYQGVRELQAVGDNGSRAVLKSPAAPGALLDNAGQLMGHWLSAHAEVDRLVLPTSIGRVELFGPHPRPGTFVDCTVTITHLDDKVLRADMLLTVDRRLWCRVTDWEDRRFTTDELVFATLQWPERTGMSVERGAYTLIDERWPDSATRDVVMRRYLGRPERDEYDRHHPLGQREFLLGRIAVKDAVRRWIWAKAAAKAKGKQRLPLFPAEIVVANEPGGRPLVRGPFVDDLRVSLAHVEGRAVAIVADGVDVGIDVERIEPRRPTFESLVLTAGEQQLTPPDGFDRDAWLTTLWAVKEAAAKATGLGLRGRPKDVEVAEVRGTTARVGDRWIAFERLPGAAPSSPSSAAQKEHIVAWTVPDR
jgi:phosphopantetheinyl transferase